MTPNETKTRKRIKRNFKTQIDDVILYCKVNIEVLSEGGSIVAPGGEVLTPNHGRIEAFRAVLKRLNVKPEAGE